MAMGNIAHFTLKGLLASGAKFGFMLWHSGEYWNKGVGTCVAGVLGWKIIADVLTLPARQYR